jgi:superkiller protein 3
MALAALLQGTTAQAQKKTFVRDYTYQAGEADSKLTARANATTQMRTNLLREVGEFLHVERTFKQTATSQDYAEKIEAITAGIVEMKTLDERWDGFAYYIKAEMTVDPKNLERRIAEVLNDKQKTRELEEARKRTLVAEAEAAKLRKELEETKNEQQRFALQTKYRQTADALSAEEYFTKGLNVQENGFNELAIEYYQQAIALDPAHVGAYNNMGVAYYDLKNYREAIRYCQKAIDIDPNPEAYNNLGIAYEGLKNYREAIRYYQKAIDLDKNDAAAYGNMGKAYNYLNNYHEAIRHLQKAIALDPNHADTYNNLGYAYNSLGNHRKAIEYLKKAIALDPSLAWAYNNIGYAYIRLGKLNESIWYFQQAARLGLYEAQKILRSIGEGW